MTEASTSENFNWMIDDFVQSTVGVTDAISVSSDGLLIASSRTLNREGAEHVAAIVTGLVSLADGASRSFDFGAVNQLIVAMDGGYLFVSSINSGSALGVVAKGSCDVALVGYQTTLLVEKAAAMLTPALIAELRVGVVS